MGIKECSVGLDIILVLKDPLSGSLVDAIIVLGYLRMQPHNWTTALKKYK